MLGNPHPATSLHRFAEQVGTQSTALDYMLAGRNQPGVLPAGSSSSSGRGLGSAHKGTHEVRFTKIRTLHPLPTIRRTPNSSGWLDRLGQYAEYVVNELWFDHTVCGSLGDPSAPLELG